MSGQRKAREIMAEQIGMPDDEQRQQEQTNDRLARWQAWLAESDQLATAILKRRQGQPVDIDALWQAERAELERRDKRNTSFLFDAQYQI